MDPVDENNRLSRMSKYFKSLTRFNTFFLVGVEVVEVLKMRILDPDETRCKEFVYSHKERSFQI